MKNVAENLAITIIALIVGVFVGFTISIKTTERIVASQEETIREAIRKETTAINNTVNNQFDKIKSKKSEPINIVIKPESNSAIQNNEDYPQQELQDQNTESIIKDKGFFGRLFSADPNKKAERKARRQRRNNN
jgi:Na+-transporting NADH:ubiquinone oxidoreductase subunit NqrA